MFKSLGMGRRFSKKSYYREVHTLLLLFSEIKKDIMIENTGQCAIKGKKGKIGAVQNDADKHVFKRRKS